MNEESANQDHPEEEPLKGPPIIIPGDSPNLANATPEERLKHLRNMIGQREDLDDTQKEEMLEQIIEQMGMAEQIADRAKILQHNLLIVRSGSTTFIGEPDGKLKVHQAGKLNNVFITIMTEQGIRLSNYPWAADAPVTEVEVFPDWIMPLRNQSTRMKRDVAVNFAKLETQLKLQAKRDEAAEKRALKEAEEGPKLVQPATEADIAPAAAMTEAVTLKP